MLSNVSNTLFLRSSRVYMYVRIEEYTEAASNQAASDSWTRNNFPGPLPHSPLARAYAFYGLHPRDLKILNTKKQEGEKKRGKQRNTRIYTRTKRER